MQLFRIPFLATLLATITHVSVILGQVIVPNPINPLLAPEEIRYGDRVILRHKNSGLFLTGQLTDQKIVCSKTRTRDCYWIFKGPHKINSPMNCAVGTTVKKGDVIRLESLSSGKNISNTNMVMLSGVGGIGSTSDNWKLAIASAPEGYDIKDTINITVDTGVTLTDNNDLKRILVSSASQNSPSAIPVSTTITKEDPNTEWVIDSFDALVSLPTGFEREYGLTLGITCGCKNNGQAGGSLEVWSLSEDRNSLRRYNPSSMLENPWEAVPALDTNNKPLGVIDDISVSSDGTLGILLNSGKAFLYNWSKKQFIPFPSKNLNLNLDGISIGSKSDMYAVDASTKCLYKHNGSDWAMLDNGNTLNVAAGLDGTVVVIDKNGIPLLYKGNNQYEYLGTLPVMAQASPPIATPGSINPKTYPSIITFESVAVGNMANIIATTSNGELYKFESQRKQWFPFLCSNGVVASGIKDIAINASGTIFATSRSCDIWNNGEAYFIATSITPLSDAEKTDNQNMKAVTGTTKDQTKAASRLQARREGRIKIVSHIELANIMAKAQPQRRQKKKRVFKRQKQAVPQVITQVTQKIASKQPVSTSPTASPQQKPAAKPTR